MSISVLIPTYNRSKILAMTLAGLEAQDFDHEKFEVIVVNDGSQDDTTEVLKKQYKFNLTSITQENAGQGNARNNGLQHAKGNIVILIGDDMIPGPTFLSEHWKSHQENPGMEFVVLGLIEWHPELEINDFMNWMVNGSSILGKFGGHQFAYEKLNRGEQPDFNFFYTSNLSFKRSFVGKNPFDPIFSKYGWEDIELGYRLQKERGMKMIYNKDAVTYHYHPMDDSGMKKRMEMIGRSAHIIDRKYPELRKVPSPMKKVAFVALSNPISLGSLHLGNRATGGRLQSLYYYALSKKYFLRGIKSGYTIEEQ
jgi:glycosyltransferase involved in cell wall biosynthesis